MNYYEFMSVKPRLGPGSAASGRTIHLREDFAAPLAAGCLGFDCAIPPGGGLGPPISSRAALIGGGEQVLPPPRPQWVFWRAEPAPKNPPQGETDRPQPSALYAI